MIRQGGWRPQGSNQGIAMLKTSLRGGIFERGWNGADIFNGAETARNFGSRVFGKQFPTAP